MTDRNWKPRRKGPIYCAPACGGRCTWKAYQTAKRESAKLVKALGAGWSAYVWENLDWHYQVENKSRLLIIYPEAGGTYLASLNGKWTGYGRTPLTAIRSAIREAKPELAEMKAIISTIEGTNL